MWLRRPSLADAVQAALYGITVAVFMLPTTVWAVPAALVTAALVLVVPQRPLIAGVLLAALCWTGVRIGENAAYLVSYFIGVYSLGRYAPLVRGSMVALCFAIVGLSSWDPGTIAFAVILTGCIFGYGRVVQLRAREGWHARRSAAELQATDAAMLATRVVADERARLGGQSLGLLRGTFRAGWQEHGYTVEAVLSIEPVAKL